MATDNRRFWLLRAFCSICLLCVFHQFGFAEVASRTSTSAPDDGTPTIRVVGTRQTRTWLEPQPSMAMDLQDRPLRLEALGDVVDELPGVTVFRQGGLGASQFLSMRGSDFDQNTVLIDDIPIVGPDRASVDLSLIPLNGFRSIEVFQGGAPIRYGGGTIGGVVRLVPRWGEQRQVSVRAAGGSFGTYYGRSDFEGWAKDLSFQGSFGLFRAENNFRYLDGNATFSTPEDDRVLRRRNAHVDQGNGLLLGSYEHRGHRVVLLGMAVYQQRGLPGPSVSIGTESAQARLRLFSSVGYRGGFVLGGRKLEVFATAAVGYDRDEVDDPLGEIGLGREDTEDEFLSFEGRLGSSWSVFSWWTVGATAFYRRDGIQTENLIPTPQEDSSLRQLLTLATESSWDFKEFALPLVLRASVSGLFSRAKLRNDETTGEMLRRLDQDAVLFRGELTLEPWNGVRVSSLISSGTRLPSILELFGNRDTVVGNSALVPEGSFMAELGLAYQKSFSSIDLSARAVGFWRRVENLILARQATRQTVTFLNQRQGESLGVEGFFRAKYKQSFESLTTLSWLNATFDNRGFRLEESLRVPLKVWQRLSIGSNLAPPVTHFRVWVEFGYRSGFFADPANLVRQQAYGAFNVGARLGFLEDRFVLAASVRNLTSEDGVDLLAFPRPRRAFEVALEWREIF